MSKEGRTRIALITGGNSGIGKHTAIGLLQRGYRVAITSRDPQRGEAAKAEIERLAGGGEVDCLRLDLASFASIHACADDVLERFARLDLLVNNAGLILADRRETAEGIETTFGVNHIGHFLLTMLLLPRLTASAPSRIVNVSSDAHKGARGGLDFDDLELCEGYGGFKAYCRSKLANIYFTRELARRYADRGITAYAVHPGAVASGFGRDGDLRGVTGALFSLARPLMIGPDKGARTSLHVATAPLPELDNGGYYAKCKLAKLAPVATDDDASLRLWVTSERLIDELEAVRDTRVDDEPAPPDLDA
ncbi:MAG: SDR family oxidoreductase [Nannocystaceae bacterium]